MAAARRFFRKLLKRTGAVERVVVTDKLRPHGAVHHEVIPSMEHRQSKHLNNRAESSRQPTRQRERAMKGFRSVGGAQRFLSAFAAVLAENVIRPGQRPVSGPAVVGLAARVGALA